MWSGTCDYGPKLSCVVSLTKIREPLPNGVECTTLSEIKKSSESSSYFVYDEDSSGYMGIDCPNDQSFIIINGRKCLEIFLKSTSHVPIDRSDWWDSLTWSEGIFIKNQATRAYFKRGNQSYSEQRFLIFFQDSFLSGHLHIISPFDAPIHYEGRTYKKNDIITFNIARDEHGAKGLLNNAVVFINDNPKRIFIPSSHMQKLHLITTLEHSVNDKSFSFFKSESHSHLTKADVQLRHSLYKCLNESSAPGSAVFVDGNLDDRPGSTILTFPVDDGTGYLKCSYHKGASHTYVYTASLDRLVLELRGKSLSHFKITSADGIITTLSDGALNLNLHKRKMWVYISFEDDHIMVSGRKHCR